MRSKSIKKISVIIPVHSERPYLNEALDSVINQTYQDLAWAYSQFALFVEKNIPDIFTTKQLNRLIERRDFYERYTQNSFN